MLASKRNMLSCMILRANEAYSSRELLVEYSVHACGQALIHDKKAYASTSITLRAYWIWLQAYLCETV